MRKFFAVFALLFVMSAALMAQDVTNLYAAGVSYNSSSNSTVAGSALYAHKLADTGTYAFTVVDALPATTKPFTVTTNIGAGVAQKVLTIGKIPVFIPTAAGVSYNGSNAGWAWSTGAMASISLKGSWKILPNVRLLKSSVSSGSGYQPIVGVMIGWGQ